jgi:hypothetical protein
MAARRRIPSPEPSLRPPDPGPGAAAWIALGAAFLGIALLVYGPSLSGPFVSDDDHYVATNDYVHGLSLENAAVILDPLGPATLRVVNYAPVQLLVHAAVWEAFGSDVRAHHAVNVALHALASLLLGMLLLRSGLPRAGALAGALFFLLHPANVEAVAWISQLKSTAAMCLALLALLAFPRRPGLATALFGLALCAKPTAAFVLPVAILLAWARRESLPWRWYALAAALFAVFSVFEFAVHQRSGAAEAVLHDTPGVLLRTVFALALRYLVMGVSSWGTSAFHEPEPARSLLDPWWLASLPVLGLLAWRLVHVARRRLPETAYWVWAIVSFAPVSQVFPFLYPMADRYLYFILPGLLGGGLLAGRDALDRLPAERRRLLARAALPAALALALVFALRAGERARIWASPALLLQDAARNYPEGVSASLLRAKRAAQVGDGVAAAAALRAAAERGFNRFEQILIDPGLTNVRDHPAVQSVVRELAAGWIESLGRKPDATQGELRTVAKAHAARGEYAQAEAVLRRALARGGREDARIRADLEALAGLAGPRAR